jgi:hypothetical protein
MPSTDGDGFHDVQAQVHMYVQWLRGAMDGGRWTVRAPESLNSRKRRKECPEIARGLRTAKNWTKVRCATEWAAVAATGLGGSGGPALLVAFLGTSTVRQACILHTPLPQFQSLPVPIPLILRLPSPPSTSLPLPQPQHQTILNGNAAILVALTGIWCPVAEAGTKRCKAWPIIPLQFHPT